MSAQESEFKFTVLVVDDNVTCLNIVSSMLKRWKYEVFSANCPIKALAISRARDVDLILSDLYMPKMNGLELQKQVEAETKLPVIIMSSDNNENTILKSLSSGAIFFMSKPVNLLDLKNIWQHAVRSKRDRSMRYIEKIKSIQAAGSLAIGTTSYNGENNSAPLVNEIRHTENKKDSKRKSQKKNKDTVEGENSTYPKKPKVNWNHDLHNLFMQAIRHITLEKAVPRNILEFMNVPGLTRENVASHLQKYRIFLKKVGEKGLVATTKNSMTLDRTLRSSFAAGHSPMMLMNNSQETYSPFKGLENQTNFDSIGGLSSNNSRLASSSSSSYGFGKSDLLGGNIQANVHEPFLSNINPLHQSNRTDGFRLGSNEIGTNMLSGGCAMPMNGKKSMQIPNNLYNNVSSTPSFKTSGIWNPGYDATGNNDDIESTRSWNFSFSNSNSNVNCCNTNDSGRVQVNNDGNVIPRLKGVDGLSRASDFGLINNEAQNRSLGVEAVGDSTSDTSVAPTSFSSANFVQGNTSTLPSVAQQQFSVHDNELNDFVSCLMNDNNNTASGFSEPQQFKEFADMLMEKNNNSQFLYHQQQGGERVENPNLTSNSSLPPQTNQPPTSQPQDRFQFPTPLIVQENHHWNEPSLEQLLEIQELLNSGIEDTSGNSSG